MEASKKAYNRLQFTEYKRIHKSKKKKKKEGKEKVRKQDGETKRELFRENY